MQLTEHIFQMWKNFYIKASWMQFFREILTFLHVEYNKFCLCCNFAWKVSRFSQIVKISPKYIEKIPVPLHIFKSFSDTQKKIWKEMFEACIYSELHQVSCGPINFGFKYHFVGEKGRQSGPIGHIFFKMLDFTWVHFVAVFQP